MILADTGGERSRPWEAHLIDFELQAFWET